jgi:hypothetical protein
MRKSSAMKTGGLLLLLIGAGAAAHFTLPADMLGKLGHVGKLTSAGAEQLSPSSLSAIEAAQMAPAGGAPRVFSPATPLVRTAKPARDVQLAELPVRDVPVSGRAPVGFGAPVSAEGSRRLASSKPTDDDARRELTRDLQTELKRVGCFDGDISGIWSPASKKAMSAFMDRVNATLPVEDPDYILLTLVQGHSAQACGKGCPAGQGLSSDGRCQPRAILAQSARKSDERKLVDRGDRRPTAEPGGHKTADVGAVQTNSISKPAVSASGAASGAWTTSTTASVEQPKASAPAPMPGRMAMGAPVPSPDETARLDDLDARKRRAQAALLDEQKLQAKAQAEAERIKAERIAAEAQRREEQLAEAERKKIERMTADVDRREKQVAAADARRSAQRQAEALEASAPISGGEKLDAKPLEAKADDGKAGDGGKLAALAGAGAIALDANERRAIARRARESREREQERVERERERRVAAATPPPQVNVRRPPPPAVIYRPTVARAAPAPTPRPAPEQRWTRTIFSDITRSR